MQSTLGIMGFKAFVNVHCRLKWNRLVLRLPRMINKIHVLFIPLTRWGLGVGVGRAVKKNNNINESNHSTSSLYKLIITSLEFQSLCVCLCVVCCFTLISFSNRDQKYTKRRPVLLILEFFRLDQNLAKFVDLKSDITIHIYNWHNPAGLGAVHLSLSPSS